MGVGSGAAGAARAAAIICKAWVKYGRRTLGRHYNLKRSEKVSEEKEGGKSQRRENWEVGAAE